MYEKKDLDSLPVNGRKLPPMAVESDPVFSILPRKNNVNAESQSYNWGIKKDVPVASWSARTNLLGAGAHSDTSKGRNYDTVVFAGPVEVANQKGFVAAVVIKKDTSNRYYLHEIIDSTGNIFKIKNGTEKAFKTGFIAENGAAGANSVPKISSGSDTDVPEFNQINEPVGSPSNHVQDAKPSAYNNIIEDGGEKFNGNVDKTVSAQERLKIQTTDPDAYRLGFIDLKQNKATNKILMGMKKAYRKQNYTNGKGNTESIRKKFYSVSK